LRFELHFADPVDFAIDVVIVFDQTNIIDPGSNFHNGRGAFHLQILDNGDRIAILENVSGAVPNLFIRGLFSALPRRGEDRLLVSTLGTHVQEGILIG
jgi:hypothetical protein